MPHHAGMIRTLRKRARHFLSIVAGLAIALPAEAEIVAGPRFQLDPPVSGSLAWGNQTLPRIATSPSGTLVLWQNGLLAASGAPQAQPTSAITGALLSGAATTRIEASVSQLALFGGGYEVAFGGKGFVVAYEAEAGLVAVRLSATGVRLDETPRLIYPRGAFASVRVIDLDCNADGRCLLLAHATDPGCCLNTARFELTAFGWDSAASAPSYLGETSADEQTGALAHDSAGFIAVYAGSSAGLHAQRFDPSGVKLGAVVDLGSKADSRPVLLEPTDDGFALVWWVAETTPGGYAVARVGRLNGQAQLLGFDALPETSNFQNIHALTTVGSDIVLFLCAPDGTGTSAMRLASDGTSEALGLVIPKQCPERAGYDGSRHLLAWDNSWQSAFDGAGWDVYAAWLEKTPAPGADPFPVSRADNTQWMPRTAQSLEQDGRAFVAWNDNRSGLTQLFGVAFDSSGCPVGAALPVKADETEQSLSAVAAAASGFFVLGRTLMTQQPYFRNWIAQVDLAGAPLGDPNNVTPLIEDARAFWPNARGGFTVDLGNSDASNSSALLFIEPDGQTRAGPQVPSSNFWVGRLDHEGFRVSGFDTSVLQCLPDPMADWPLPSGIRIDFFSLTTGAETRPPIIEPADPELPCTLGVELSVAPDGYTFVWRQGESAFNEKSARQLAGSLGLDGTWSGRTALPADRRTSPTRVGGELWWFLLQSSKLAVARTTLGFEELGIETVTDAVGHLADAEGNYYNGFFHLKASPTAFVVGTGAPTLVDQWVAPNSSAIRVVGYRLDGTQCPPSRTPTPPRSRPPQTPTPPNSVDPDLFPTGGCACRSENPAGPTRSPAEVLVLLAWLMARARRRRPPVVRKSGHLPATE